MRLCQSHDQSCEFGMLTQVKSGYIMLFFNFLCMRLSRSDDPGHRFRGTTWVVFYTLFLIDFFFNQFAFHEIILVL